MILEELKTRAEGTTIRSQGHTMLSTLGHMLPRCRNLSETKSASLTPTKGNKKHSTGMITTHVRKQTKTLKKSAEIGVHVTYDNTIEANGGWGVILIGGSGVLAYTGITRTGPLRHLTDFIPLYSMNAPLERGCFGSFPSLPWKGKSSKSMLTRSREGTGAACHLGVRSLTGALGLPQNRAGLEDGDLEALQKDHSQADRPQCHRVCVNGHVCTHARKTQDFIFTTQVGRKRRLL